MNLLKQSTSIEIGIGPFLDETDGKTAETALTISQADIRLKKGAGDWAQSNDAGGATHEENGWYRLTLDATDTNTLGQLLVAIHESGALPVWREFLVVPANVYDSVVGGSDLLDVNVEEWNATAVPAEHTAGYPVVTVKDGTGTGEINTASGAVVQVDQLGTQAKADVNAEVLDVLSVDTFGEPTGVPGATITLREKIGWLFMALRNKVTVTATKKTFYDDGDAAEWEKDLSDDGTTYTETEGNAI